MFLRRLAITSSSDLSLQTRSWLALALMLGGLAVAYPRYLHPMLLTVLGRHSEVSFGGGGAHSSANLHPSQLRNPPLPGGWRRPVVGTSDAKLKDNSVKEAATTEAGGGGEGGGKRGGLATVALPVYAVGILLYLAYTLFKAFVSGGGAGVALTSAKRGFGSSAASAEAMREQALRDYYRNFRYDPISGQFVNGPQSTDDYFGGGLARNATPEADQEARYQRMRSDLERLLHRLDDQDASEADLLRLKARLEDTERQMASVLAAMRPQARSDGDGAAADVDEVAEYDDVEAEADSDADSGVRRRRLPVD